jgi:CDP-glycerol glycerophosphotransferase (TagB/SpsB family)
MDGRKIVIAGSIYYDKALKKGFNFLSREHICLKLGINIKKDILVFTSQPLPQSDLLHRALIETMERFPDKHLVIKMHPLESGMRSFWKAKSAKLRNVSVVKNIDTWSLINCCELLITVSSITAAEAMILKKPVIIFGLNLDFGVAPFIEEKAVFSVNRYQDLPSAIDKIFNDDTLKERMIARADKFIQENLGPHDGQVDKRIIGLINNLISQ